MAYLEKLLPEFRKGAKIRCKSWKKDWHIRIANGNVYDQEDEIYSFNAADFKQDCWEFYQEPVDWKYIIDNKCLCWFWDDVDSLEESSYGYLTYHNKNILYCYNGKKWYKNCRPVRKDEVTFYEDNKDE